MRKAFLILAPVLFILVSCSSVRNMAGAPSNTTACPDAGILKGAERRDFSYDGTDYTVIMHGLTGGCTRLKSSVRVSSAVTIDVRPATGQPIAQTALPGVRLEVFTAGLNNQEDIISRQSQIVNVPLDPTGAGQVVQTLQQVIPLNGDETAAEYKIVYGFTEDTQ